MSVLSLTDAKKHLNIRSGDHDGELQDFIDAAEAAIVEKCGPLTSTTVTERIRGGGRALALRETPVVSLTSITPVGGTAYTVSDFDVDKSAGVVEWGSGGWFATGRYDVVYQAGRAEVPDDLLLGVKELVRHLWSTSQRGPTTRPGSPPSAESANTVPGAGHILPFRVLELISAHEKVAI